MYKPRKLTKRAKRQPSCKVWDAFLRIPDPSTTDEAPVADESWFATKGVYSSAPAVLRLLQREVLPLVRRLTTGYDQSIGGYYFLVHDRESGVPTTKEDKGGYIHMRFYFWAAKTSSGVQKILGDKWEMLRPIHDEGDKVAGIDEKLLRNRSEGAAAIREILKAQSELALKIVETYVDDADPLVVIQQIRQCLHWTANMFQMKVVG